MRDIRLTDQQPFWRGAWKCSTFIALGLAAAFANSVPGQITAKQGDQDPSEFHGSMTLEVPFLPAVPDLLPKMTDWYTTADFISLRKFTCDRIRIWPFRFRVKKPATNGKIKVEMRISFLSPDQNHDKMVELTLEAHNGERIIGTVKRSIKVEEGNQINRDLEFPINVSDLKADPVTQLRITVKTKDV